MKRSTKAGITSAALLVSIFLPPYSEWRAPVKLACVVAACVLGALAAASGKRWWLVIPGSIVAGLVLVLYNAIYAF